MKKREVITFKNERERMAYIKKQYKTNVIEPMTGEEVKKAMDKSLEKNKKTKGKKSEPKED